MNSVYSTHIPSLFSARLLTIAVLVCVSSLPVRSYAQRPLLGKLGNIFRPQAAATEDLSKASTSAASRQQAVRMIPMDEIDQSTRGKIADVVNNTTAYRRLPVKNVKCDRDLFEYLLEQPDMIVGIWELLGVTELSLKEIEPGKFKLVDQAGTTGTVEHLYAGDDLDIFYCDGVYSGPLFPQPIHGKSVIVMKTTYTKNKDGDSVIGCRADTFVKVENAAAGLIAKMFQPLVGQVADMNYTQTLDFVADLCKVAETNNSGLERLTWSVDDVSESTKRDFVAVTGRVAMRRIQADTNYRYSIMLSESESEGTRDFQSQYPAESRDAISYDTTDTPYEVPQPSVVIEEDDTNTNEYPVMSITPDSTPSEAPRPLPSAAYHRVYPTSESRVTTIVPLSHSSVPAISATQTPQNSVPPLSFSQETAPNYARVYTIGQNRSQIVKMPGNVTEPLRPARTTLSIPTRTNESPEQQGTALPILISPQTQQVIGGGTRP